MYHHINPKNDSIMQFLAHFPWIPQVLGAQDRQNHNWTFEPTKKNNPLPLHYTGCFKKGAFIYWFIVLYCNSPQYNRAVKYLIPYINPLNNQVPVMFIAHFVAKMLGIDPWSWRAPQDTPQALDSFGRRRLSLVFDFFGSNFGRLPFQGAKMAVGFINRYSCQVVLFQ